MQLGYRPCTSTAAAARSPLTFLTIAAAPRARKRLHGNQPLISRIKCLRGHATPAADSNAPGDPIWPTPPMKVTPYTIFNLQRRAAYTAEAKQTFYRLAKLYHPDGCHHNHHHHHLNRLHHHHHHRNPKEGTGRSGLSREETVERFRLVVAAHEILSDPKKKSAYDHFGAGWAGVEGVIGQKEATNGNTRGWRAEGRMYGHDTPFANATWEDWEKWYERREEEAARERGEHQQASGKRRETIIDDRAFFFMLVLSFGAFGSVIQLLRIESQKMRLEEQRDRTNGEISRELNMLRREQMEMATREERVQNFLRVRNPQSMGVTPEEVREEKLQRILPEAEVCMSDGIQKRP